MHSSISNLEFIKKEIIRSNTNHEKINIIAVSKTFKLNQIKPLIDYGHTHFGENKIQESIDKWSEIKKNMNNLKLHFIGKLQTNKVKYVIPLFDYIHSLDSIKLAEKIYNQQNKINFKPKIFVQVNIGAEQQKSGVLINDLEIFLKDCKKHFNLNIIGLMCIPPIGNSSEKYFKEMQQLNKIYNFDDLSMGMSSDYLDAVKYGSSYVRIGSKIFGNRV
jgi:pyridoxal phosphate enzyme (YggS family)